jgi:hypothetical protein
MRPVLLVFGISGATWSVVEPLVASGLMPNLARLRARGCAGTLESVMIPGDHHYRPQAAWATLATGFAPERHGVTAFFHEAADLAQPTLWERFNRAGLTVGVYGWPGTWPPPRVRGFVVPSHLARDARTWPPELEPIKALDRVSQSAERDVGGSRHVRVVGRLVQVLWRHRIPVQTVARLVGTAAGSLHADHEERPLLLRRAKLELSTGVFLELCRRFDPDLAAFVTFYADFALHRYWRYREPARFERTDRNGPLGLATAIDRAFVDVDRVLGLLLARAGAGTVVAIVSEHGMEAEHESPEVGRWFFGIRGEAVLRFAGLSGQVVACPVARWVAYRPRAGAALPADLGARLRQITVAETGLPLFTVYENGSDEVVVKFSFPPHVTEYARGELDRLHVRFGGRTAPFTEVARRLTSRRSGMHARDGIVVLAGPGIRHGVLGTVHLVDIAPTLLHAAGLPVPEGLDGNVLDVFTG